MTIEPKLMDPERLALIEQDESLMPVSMAKGWSVAARQTEVLAVLQLIRELRAHAKHWEAEAKRYRDRCPVTAEYVKAAGVTWARALVWVGEQPDTPELRDIDHHLEHCLRSDFDVADVVNDLADQTGRPAFDILGEIAAMDRS